MKRALIIFSLLLCSLVCGAQEQNTHLRFKGIPIDGNYKDFANKLVQKDFVIIDSTNDGVALRGSFMAIPGTMVIVYPDPTSKIVSIVAAMIEVDDNWTALNNKYHEVVDTYKQKYGEPTEQVEGFAEEIRDYDSWKLLSVRNNQCNYSTKWKIDGGEIIIKLAYYLFDYYVVCSYVDDVNIKALRQTIIDDI